MANFKVLKRHNGVVKEQVVWSKEQVFTAFPELRKLFENFTVDELRLKVSKDNHFLDVCLLDD
jgi:hypothetical protein